jgi:GNAT superfamily N-acetyltransferase
LSVSGPEPFDSPDAVALTTAQQAELYESYAGENDIGPKRDASMFVEPDGVFLVVRDEDGKAVACGGVARYDETRGELKRMYVVPETRGRGLGRRVLEELEAEAVRLGYRSLVLETGTRPEALGLYTSAGYEPIPCWPPYNARELSRCFEKQL